MKKMLIVKTFMFFILVAGIFSCTSFGIQAKRLEVSPFKDVKPPYIFTVKSIRIVNKDGFPTGESFIDDFLISTGYKYNFYFVFPEGVAGSAGVTDGDSKGADRVEKETKGSDEAINEKTPRYSIDLFIKEKVFSSDLKELTAISGTLHIYGTAGRSLVGEVASGSGQNGAGKSDSLQNGTQTGNSLQNNPLLYQVVFTEESTVSINSYHKLYRVIDEIFKKLHSNLEKKQKEREKKNKKLSGQLKKKQEVSAGK